MNPYLIADPTVISFSGGRFRKDRPSYQQMYDNASNQATIDFNDETIECFCGD